MRRWIAAWVVVLWLLALLAPLLPGQAPVRAVPAFRLGQSDPAAASGHATAGDAVPGEWREALPSPPSLNPLRSRDGATRALAEVLHAGLTRIDERGRPQPELAREWQSPDLYRWVFRLDARARWHDGRQVTPQDVVATVRWVQAEANQSPWRPLWAGVRVEALDRERVFFDLPYPNADFPADAALPILPAHDLSGRTGAGPFRLATGSSQPEGTDQPVVLHRFDEYLRGRPQLKTYTFVVEPDYRSAWTGLQRGRLDALPIGPDLYPPQAVSLVREPARLDRWLSNRVWFVVARAPEVRQAWSAALRQGDPAAALGLFRLRSVLLPGTWPSSEALPNEWPLPPRAGESPASGAGDPADAAPAADAAGAAQPAAPVLLYRAESRPHAAAAARVAAVLRSGGVPLRTEAKEPDELRRLVQDGRFNALLGYWDLDPVPDLYALYHAVGKRNLAGLDDAALDELVEEGRFAPEPAARKDWLQKAEQRAAELAAFPWLAAEPAGYIYRRGLQGVRGGPFALRHNVYQWRLAPATSEP